MSDELSFLEEEVEAEAPEAVEPEPVKEPEKPKAEAKEEAPKAESTGEKEEAEAPPVQQEAQHVPITALLDEREKRQEFERRAAELERKTKEFEQKLQEAQRKPEQKAPDMFEDPDGYQRYQQQTVASGLWNQTLDTSEMVARSQHGNEVVEAATQAFMSAAQSNAGLAHELRAQKHPYQFVVDWHKRQQVLEQVGTDPEAYRAKIREEIMAEMQGQTPAPQPAPPKSVVSAPSAGREAPPMKGEAFDQMFD